MAQITEINLAELLNLIAAPDDFDVWYDGHRVKYLNEAGDITTDSRFFVAGSYLGSHTLIHVHVYRDSDDGFQTAYDAYIDSRKPIDASELVEAYGPATGEHQGESFLDIANAACTDDAPPYGTDAWDAYHQAIRAHANSLLDAAGDDPDACDLVEGYEHQSNATGTGIVSVDPTDHFHPADCEKVIFSLKGAKA